ncbi:MAG: endonuclease [Bacteriovoracaceae bacterium]|nr:endonuclease [Bacteriovoracaceae bacterium]
MQKFLLGLIFVISSLSVNASSEFYYSETNLNDSPALRTNLHNLIKKHQSRSYKTARMFLFGELHLEQEKNGGFFVKDVYCEKTYTNKEFKSKKSIGPKRIPDNRILNCEHTWPKSRFSKGRSHRSSDIYKQKVADLHHLFPTQSKMNAIRGNLEFGEVKIETNNLPCSNTSQLGTIAENSKKRFFQPPRQHRGNVARAVFYFAVRYKMNIGATEESFLRRWHIEDPVDSAEEHRNGRIQEIQGNRNPFIDYPEFVHLIENF